MTTPKNGRRDAPAKKRAAAERPLKKRTRSGPPSPTSRVDKPTADEEALFDMQDFEEATSDEILRIESKERAEQEVARRKGLTGAWEPLDLTDVVTGIMDGTLPPIVPGLLLVSPSERFLLYAGRVNGIHGHSNAGKSWTALLACKQALDAGETVVYIDHEDDERGITERLLLYFGVKPDVVLERFIYFRPKYRFDQQSVGAMLSRIKPALVVIDAVGGSLAQEGLSYLDDNHIIQWTFRVPGFIVRHGPAVLLLDHNPKDTVNGALWPIGSQRKKAAITGAQYLQERVVGFSKAKSGYSKLVTAKDRHGASAEAEVVAHLKVDIVQVRRKREAQAITRISLVDPPPQELADAVKFKQKAKALCDALADGPLNTTDLREAFKGFDNSNLGTVINQMVAAGFIKKEKHGKAVMHTLVQPYDGIWTPEELELVDTE
ncbi:hypothetical protein ARHIZOSPH14_27420 [Agromyces rhizosphaerae]|uniref:AAA family ATPase n=1 Tax=Agromyces rhizosphaerae TaxID=88374 RepID=A0A9W6FQG1_9MICO|nr:hypothetical protein [Agromyces rhizosphaerae]GLI28500.1 hypothetical protein ARHIZOSPH14_27420 [Agromyces rhizosphaerae]